MSQVPEAPSPAGERLDGVVLIVDDSLHVRAILTKRLAAAGCRTEAASDGVAGLEAAARMRPDVIVSDWTMPGMDGPALCAAVRAEPALAATYFIMLTAKETQQDRLAALEAGADDFLVKPWDELELLARIRGGLRIRRLQREIEASGERDALAKLSATLGHEINNPLTALLGELQLVQIEGKLPPGAAEGVERAAEAGRRIAEIVSRVQRARDEATAPCRGGAEKFAPSDGKKAA